jgi:nucleoid-associated protein YgaU
VAPTTAPQTEEPKTEVLGVQEHRVVSGDNLWTIARDALASATDRQPDQLSENEIRDYWLEVIDANRDNLRSQDPHWIFPGEIIQLPSIEVQAN